MWVIVQVTECSEYPVQKPVKKCAEVPKQTCVKRRLTPSCREITKHICRQEAMSLDIKELIGGNFSIPGQDTSIISICLSEGDTCFCAHR